MTLDKALINHREHRQGGWSNCWFRAALDGLAFKRPDEIVQMVRHVDDQSRSLVVTFPGRQPRTVTPYRDDDLIYASALEDAADLELGDARSPRVMSFGLGIALLTGNSRKGHLNATGFGFAPWGVWSGRKWLAERLTDATNRSRIMVLGGCDGKLRVPVLKWVKPQHCCALLAFDPTTERAHIRDPYGTDDGRDERIPAERKLEGFGPGEAWVTLDELQGSWSALSIEKG